MHPRYSDHRHGERTIAGWIQAALFALVLGIAATAAFAQQGKLDRPDRSWIALSGKIAAIESQSFMLDHGKGKVRVEMDDWDGYNEVHALSAGDRVTVYGQLDDDLFENRSVEASAVYVEKSQTYYYANPADEEPDYYSFPYGPTFSFGQEGDWVSITGEVERIEGRRMTVDTGLRDVTVDTGQLPYDPFGQRPQSIQVGNRVSAYGQVDDADFFEGRELEAVSVIRLARD